MNWESCNPRLEMQRSGNALGSSLRDDWQFLNPCLGCAIVQRIYNVIRRDLPIVGNQDGLIYTLSIHNINNISRNQTGSVKMRVQRLRSPAITQHIWNN
jgi:hypothetical protein